MKLTHEQKLQKAHTSVVRSKQFAMLVGIMLLGESKVSASIPVPTACTDGRNKYYHPALIDEVTEKQLAFAVVHENFHVMFKHLTTWQWMFKEDAQVANQACDYAINGIIVDMDPQQAVVEIKDTWLYHQMFNNWDAGRIYRYIKQNGPPNNDSEDGSGEPSGEAGKFGTGGSGEPQDEHMWEEANEISAEEQKEIEQTIDAAIRQGALLAGKVGGASPRDIGAIPEPQVDWRAQLQEFVTSVTNGGDCSTWRKPRRRWLAQDIYMPTTYTEQVGPMVVAIDASGSISREAEYFLAEVQAIVKDTPPEVLHLLYWGSTIAGEEEYRPEEYDSILRSTKLVNGGGTSPRCIEEWLKKNNNIKPAVILVLSDGYVDNWPVFDAPTLWAMTTDIKAPNAVNIKIEIGG